MNNTAGRLEKETKNGIRRMGDDVLQMRWSSLNTFFSWLVKRGL